MKKLIKLVLITFSAAMPVWGQFAPAAGENGSDAIHKDNNIFTSWAKNCTVERGYIKISDTSFTYEDNNKATLGSPSDATGKPDGSVISLGDNGFAIIEPETPVANLEGADFAVFENGFKSMEPPQQYFLELAFVEVSSDGERYVRFPAISNTQTATQTSTFGQTDPTQIHNFAGKYIKNYGTPFDLSDIEDSTGIDLQNITHIKIIDAIGSIKASNGSFDAEGNIVNDPWPTPFSSCGFDLDAVGMIHVKGQSPNRRIDNNSNDLMIFPNPAITGQRINISIPDTEILSAKAYLNIYDIAGKTVYRQNFSCINSTDVNLPGLNPGLYFVQLESANSCFIKKLIINK